MLSKVLRGDDASIAQPLQWKRAAGSTIHVPHPPAMPSQPSAANAANPQTRQIVTTHDQVEVLQARVAELERDMNKRTQDARREGENAGRTQATAQVQPMLEKLARSIQEVADLRPKLRQQAEGDLLKLALAIARKVVHREISADPEALSGLVRVAIEKVRVREIVRVRTNPQHQPIIQQIVARLSGGVQIEIQADQRVPLGGVIVETERGDFDASVDVQLREIERGLADRLATFE